MSDQMRTGIEDLILAYEDLDDDQRRRADEAMAQRPELRTRLDDVRRLERLAVDPVPGDCDPLREPDRLDPGDRAAQLASLKLVRHAAGLPATSRPWSPMQSILSLAAVLALVALFPLMSGNLAHLGQLSVRQLATDGGGHRSLTWTGDTGVLRSGQAFFLDVPLYQDARVYVFHIAPQGEIEVVPTPTDGASAAGGSLLSLPVPDSGDLWVLGGETGRETFVVAALIDPALAGPELVAAALAGAAGSTDHTGTVENLLALLDQSGVRTRRISFQHVD